jgi:Zn-finger nucleic acid-binding protein
VSYRRTDHRCVSCGAALVAYRIDDAPCELCPRCSGMWIDTVAFLQLMRKSATAQHLDELMVHNDGSPRRKCPHCGELMDLAWIDALQIDQCAEHGVWLDPGVLPKALASKS